MSNPVRPHRRKPTRLPCPWDSPGKNTGVDCHFLLQCRQLRPIIFVGFSGDQGFPNSSVSKESTCNVGDPGSIPGLARSTGEGIGYPLQYFKSTGERIRLPTPVFLGFPGGSAGKESACNVGDLGSIPGLRRSPGEGKGYPLQYSGLENSMDCIVYGVAKSRDTTEQLSLSLLSPLG